jgi:hypothetical protein
MDEIKKKAIFSVWVALSRILRELETEAADNDEEAVRLYTKLLAHLPETTLVDFKFKKPEVSIQGCTLLCLFRDMKNISDEEARNQQRAFCFYPNNRAIVYRAWYNGPELFNGTWVEALGFLIKEIYEANLSNHLLTGGQKAAMEKLIETLAK